jgi:hypothetical protein
VKKFFFSRFKRRLIKKSIIDNILIKIDKYLVETDILMRARSLRIYAICNYISRTKTFKALTIIIILFNIIALGLTHYNSSNDFDKVMDIINLGFFIFFCIELVLKLIGRGFRYYLQDKYNWFDGLVVLISAIDIVSAYAIQSKGESSSSSGALTALRVFRLIRIF